MAKDDTSDYLPVEELGVMTNLSQRPQPVRRARPVKQAYNIEAIVAPRAKPVRKLATPAVKSGSMFFRNRAGDLDKDPFLQRLARLN